MVVCSTLKGHREINIPCKFWLRQREAQQLVEPVTVFHAPLPLAVGVSCLQVRASNRRVKPQAVQSIPHQRYTCRNKTTLFREGHIPYFPHSLLLHLCVLRGTKLPLHVLLCCMILSAYSYLIKETIIVPPQSFRGQTSETSGSS